MLEVAAVSTRGNPEDTRAQNERHDDADAIRVLLKGAKALVPGGNTVLLAFGITKASKCRVGVDNGLVEFTAFGQDLAVPEFDQLGFHGTLLELELHVEFVTIGPRHEKQILQEKM